MANPQLIQDARAGKAGLYIQFGGQGAPWFKELKSHYDSSPEVKRIIDIGLSALEEEKANVAGTIGLPKGIDVRSWLDDESKVPDEEYLGCAAVSIPLIQLTQLAHYEALSLAGFDRRSIPEITKGFTGHSQGLIPASLAAMGLSDQDYDQAVSKYMKYLLYLGVRAQEAFPHFEATAEETARNQALGMKGSPTPMVAFLGTDVETVRKMMGEVNSSLPADQQIYVSLVNSPTNTILSSYRSSLVAFHEKHKAAMDEQKLKYVYIRTTCPFHCPIMQGVKEPFSKDIVRIGFTYKGSDLKAPVYSFFDARNMQSDGDALPVNMSVDMAINPLFWEKSVSPAAKDKGVTHVVDFGPGKASQRLTQDTLKDLGCETPVLSASVPRDLKTLTA